MGSKNLKTIWERVNDVMEDKVSKAAVIEEVNKIKENSLNHISLET
jgi:hypothetical protein